MESVDRKIIQPHKIWQPWTNESSEGMNAEQLFAFVFAFPASCVCVYKTGICNRIMSQPSKIVTRT
jgi:hypothetical protein